MSVADDDDAARLERALAAIRMLRTRVDELERDSAEPIAIVGVGCRFPGAPSPDAYWELLREGMSAIGEIPSDRWDVDAYYDPDPDAPGKSYTRRGGFLDDVSGFDAAFFGVSPHDAKRLDPQQRLLLEVVWEALEDAAIDPRTLEGAAAGVFVGISESEYLARMHALRRPFEMQDITGTASSVAGGRVSYWLGLQGPNVALDTACSSSLVAVHLGVVSLRRRESDLVLAGGVNVMLSPDAFVAFCRGRALSRDGYCKSFDAAADGYSRGEGCGVLVLKRLADALADGDDVRAVIRGTAVNQDGRTNGLTAPNGLAQQAVIRAALADAGLSPASVGYVEAHGTGTALGDPIEAGALAAVFANRSTPLLVGTAKTNIGHLENAAGVAGLLKAVAAIEHGQIPPSLHFHDPSPHIPWDEVPIVVPTELRVWPRDAPAAGVSAFGFSGTNAHIVLEPAPPPAESPEVAIRSHEVLVLSARTPEALNAVASAYADRLDRNPQLRLRDVCGTAATGRAAFEHRLAVVAPSLEDCRDALATFASGDARRVATGRAAGPPSVAFLFTGQGSQYPGMAHELYASHAGFRAAIDRCDELLRAGGTHDAPLLAALYPQPGSEGDSLLERTSYAQPAIFAVEYALAELWQSWGVEPSVVLGHSTGEYAAACVAGVLSLEDALALVARRALLIETATADGVTAAVFGSVEMVAPVLAAFEPGIGVAGVNGPRETLVAGAADVVHAALAALKDAGIDCRILRVPHAPHSPLVDPVLDEFEAFAANLTYDQPRVPLISNVTGSMVGSVDARYWRRHMREPVRFDQGVRTLQATGCRAVLELGPQPVLQLLARQNWQGEPVRWLSSLAAARSDWAELLRAAGELWAGGAPIAWRHVHDGFPYRRVRLPTYPFERVRYWLEDGEEQEVRQENAMPAAELAAPVLKELTALLAASLELDAADVDVDRSFVELGANSLVVARLVQEIEDVYGVSLGIGRLFDDLDTLASVAAEVERAAPPSSGPSRAAPVAAAPVDGDVRAVIAAQLDLMGRQLELLRGEEPHSRRPIRPPATTAPRPAPERRVLDEGQHRHLEELVATVQARTAGSRERAMTGRALRADTRLVAVRPETRSLAYPVLGERADGARFWDVDGNEYVDLAMGIGVLLCGHYPPFVATAISEQAAKGIQTGPVSPLADEVAALVAELTGAERVAFAVNGTDAVRTALRVAQAATGRSRFAMFSGSYHGQDDRVLALPDLAGDPTRSVPMAPGISPAAAGDALVLTYGARAALEAIEGQADELAAVLVEPVQSRNPALQPRAFLHELRELTRRLGIPLVFDEVITGFRVHPRGAAGVFGVEPDISAYGKALGGGLPISVVAGRAEYLDWIDGGADLLSSPDEPDAATTYVGSTFELHPFALAAARAMLLHLKREGPQLQDQLNERTEALAVRLDAIFEDEGAPIRVLRFGSVFRFAWKDNASYAYQPLEMELFHLHLLARGIYLWEGRTCFLSTAHTDADLDAVVAMAAESVAALRDGGLLTGPGAVHVSVPLTDDQRAVLDLAFADPPGSPAWTVADHLLLRGRLDLDALGRAVHALVGRHDALRAVFPGRERLEVRPAVDGLVRLVDLPDADEEAVAGWWRDELALPFDLSTGPLVRVAVLRLAPDVHRVALVVHHLVCDGWSMGVLVEELASLYSAEAGGPPAALGEPLAYGEFVRRSAARRAGAAVGGAGAYRLTWFGDRPSDASLPFDHVPTGRPSNRADRISVALDAERASAVRELARSVRATPFVVLLAAYGLLVSTLTGSEEVMVGVPRDARTLEGAAGTVGYCAGFMPVRILVDPKASTVEYVGAVRRLVLETLERGDAAFESRDGAVPMLPATVFNLDPTPRVPSFHGLDVELRRVPVCAYSVVDFRIDATEASDGALWLDCDYRTDLLERETAVAWCTRYCALLEALTAGGELTVAELIVAVGEDELSLLSLTKESE